MTKEIKWFVDDKLNIEEINDFALKYVESKNITFYGVVRERKPFYMLFKTERKNKPWSIRFGYYQRTTAWTNAKPYECEWHEVKLVWLKSFNHYVSSWNPILGKEEHKIDNRIYLSNSLSSLRKIQKQFNSK